MRLHVTPNANPRLAAAVARHLGSDVELVVSRPRDPAHEEAFRPLNPNTLAPVLETDAGPLWETDAIACFLSRRAGSDFWRQGDDEVEMIRWVSWTGWHFVPDTSETYFQRIVLPTFSKNPPDEEKVAAGIVAFRRHAAILDRHLADRPYMLGERLSYADFRVGTYLPYADRAGYPIADFANLDAFNKRLMAIDAWRDPFGDLSFSRTQP